MSREFTARASLARKVPTLYSFTNAATDWVRIAAFAGFDTAELMRRVLAKPHRGEKINAASVQNMMGEIFKESLATK